MCHSVVSNQADFTTPIEGQLISPKRELLQIPERKFLPQRISYRNLEIHFSVYRRQKLEADRHC